MSLSLSLLARRSPLSSLLRRGLHVQAPLQGGAGMPIGPHIVPTAPLPDDDELIWDDGSPFPEPCPDVVAPQISENGGAAMLGIGLGLLATIATAAAFDDPVSRIPWTPRELIVDEVVDV